MNTVNTTEPIVILETGKSISLFRLVGLIQVKIRGLQFHELKLVVQSDTLYIQTRPYDPTFPNVVVIGLPDSLHLASKQLHRFSLEHLLELARDSFAGRNFQEIHISVSEGLLHFTA